MRAGLCDELQVLTLKSAAVFIKRFFDLSMQRLFDSGAGKILLFPFLRKIVGNPVIHATAQTRPVSCFPRFPATSQTDR